MSKDTTMRWEFALYHAHPSIRTLNPVHHADSIPEDAIIAVFRPPWPSLAHARLMASAPELLAACQEAREIILLCVFPYDAERVLAQLDAAIAKATEGGDSE